MAMREAKLDLDALMRSAAEAKREIDRWPTWKREAAEATFVSRLPLQHRVESGARPKTKSG